MIIILEINHHFLIHWHFSSFHTYQSSHFFSTQTQSQTSMSKVKPKWHLFFLSQSHWHVLLFSQKFGGHSLSQVQAHLSSLKSHPSAHYFFLQTQSQTSMSNSKPCLHHFFLSHSHSQVLLFIQRFFGHSFSGQTHLHCFSSKTCPLLQI